MRLFLVLAIIFLVVLLGVALILGFLWEKGGKEHEAKLGLKKIDEAIEMFKKEKGDYPPNLSVLAQPYVVAGKPPFLAEQELLDPWERPFCYEPGTRNPKTGKPLIYSLGPDPKDPNSRITNWNGK